MKKKKKHNGTAAHIDELQKGSCALCLAGYKELERPNQLAVPPHLLQRHPVGTWCWKKLDNA